MQQWELTMKRWIDQEDLDETLRKELLALTSAEEQREQFYRDLEFGTGGLRGILGVGTNRMNRYTVRRATQGFADYIKKYFGPGGEKYNGKRPAVALSYDSRIQSDAFAVEAALVLAANGIKVYLYPELMPTPALSFAVRYYGCAGGIMVTASHNPALYNGYKAYDEQGCQLTLEAAEEVLLLMEKIDLFSQVKLPAFANEFKATLAEKLDLAQKLVDEEGEPLVSLIPSSVAAAYLEAVIAQRIGVADGGSLSVVYTPLNGTGNKPVRRILEMIGVREVTVVPEQELPDGRFPTCPYPNPEKKEALALGLQLCLKRSEEGNPPDLLLATDPDCDRVGIAVHHGKDEQGNEAYPLLSGNEVGILLLDFICQHRSLPERPLAIKTIVTSKMAEAVAAHYGVEMINVLTGFKFIGEQLAELEAKGEEERFLFGFEESYGYLAGSYVRDKDAVNASMLICEMAAWVKSQGLTLVDQMEKLYQRHGFYQNDLMEFAFEGAAGMDKMAAIMANLRTAAPKDLVGKKIVESADYQASQRRISGGCCGMEAGTKSILLPKSDVLEYVLADGSSFIVRPSGTEPKLKIYLSSKGKSLAESNAMIGQMRAALQEKIEEITSGQERTT